jgi:hypothetical protein
MSIDLEYAIKKDIRNNPVIRELDTRERREIRRTIWLAGLTVGLLIFAVWQRVEMVQHGMDIEKLRTDLVHEENLNRQLRLNLETLRAPQEIEGRARRELGMGAAGPGETLIIERVAATSPRGAVAAQVR